MEKEELIKKLEEGNQKYIEGCLDFDYSKPLRNVLISGQNPKILIFSCSDSRANPEAIFNLSLGEAFIIRSAGHIFDESVKASFDYAINHLHIKYVIVLAHTSCGAVGSALKDFSKETPALKALLEQVKKNVVSASSYLDAVKLNLKGVADKISKAYPKVNVLKYLYDLESAKACLIGE